MIVLYTFSEEAEHKWLYWEARHSVTRIDKYTSAPFSNVERSANEVWMFWTTQVHLQKSYGVWLIRCVICA